LPADPKTFTPTTKQMLQRLQGLMRDGKGGFVSSEQVSLSLSLLHGLCLSFSSVLLSISHTLSLLHSLSHSLSLSRSLLSLTLTLTLPLSHYLSLSHSHTLTFSLSLSHLHTLSLSPSHSLSLYHPLSWEQSQVLDTQLRRQLEEINASKAMLDIIIQDFQVFECSQTFSSENGSYKTVKAQFWPWLSDRSPWHVLSRPLFA